MYTNLASSETSFLSYVNVNFFHANSVSFFGLEKCQMARKWKMYVMYTPHTEYIYTYTYTQHSVTNFSVLHGKKKKPRFWLVFFSFGVNF